jgi:hypothetical protein
MAAKNLALFFENNQEISIFYWQSQNQIQRWKYSLRRKN